MSYNDTHCPCGGDKDPDTMLCPACLTAFADRHETSTFFSTAEPATRRTAAVILLALAHRRTKIRPLALEYTA